MGAACLLVLLSTLAGCNLAPRPFSTPSAIPRSPTASSTALSHSNPRPQPSATINRTPRSVFPTPRIAPITPIPDPVRGLVIQDDLRLLVLLGNDQPSPFISRSQAIMLVFYNPRLAKTALLSIPPETFVYIPGYTMQRINVAYAIGGFTMLADTIEYNFGVRPDEYAVIHVDDFAWFVEELNGLDVDVFRDYYDVCGGVPAGSVHFMGGDMLCYVQFREGWDIRDQAERQQQVVWRLFMRMVSGGKLVELEPIYQTYKAVVQSNLTLNDLLASVPLALRMGQVERFGFFQPTFTMFNTWDIPGDVQATVLLPRGDLFLQLIQDAINFTTIAVQSSDMILTLEYEMTISPTPSNTPTPSSTPTMTQTSTVTVTPTPPTTTPTTAGYPAPSPSVTTAGYP